MLELLSGLNFSYHSEIGKGNHSYKSMEEDVGKVAEKRLSANWQKSLLIAHIGPN